jgi:hypothetical protein
MISLFLLPGLVAWALATLPLMSNRPTPDPNSLLDRAEAARFLRQGVRTLDRQVHAGEVPHYRLPNGRVMFDPADLKSLVAGAYRPASDD